MSNLNKNSNGNNRHLKQRDGAAGVDPASCSVHKSTGRGSITTPAYSVMSKAT